LNGETAKEKLLEQLRSKQCTFIYHCYNHYCCPIGYEQEPIDREKIFNQNSGKTSNSDFIDWILIAHTSRKYPSIHCVKWSDIETDLNSKSPQFLNIRHLDRGVQSRISSAESTTNLNHHSDNSGRSSSDKNLHCIIKFESFKEPCTSSNSIRSDFMKIF
jgi:hypothetical protein